MSHYVIACPRCRANVIRAHLLVCGDCWKRIRLDSHALKFYGEKRDRRVMPSGRRHWLKAG